MRPARLDGATPRGLRAHATPRSDAARRSRGSPRTRAASGSNAPLICYLVGARARRTRRRSLDDARRRGRGARRSEGMPRSTDGPRSSPARRAASAARPRSRSPARARGSRSAPAGPRSSSSVPAELPGEGHFARARRDRRGERRGLRRGRGRGVRRADRHPREQRRPRARAHLDRGRLERGRRGRVGDERARARAPDAALPPAHGGLARAHRQPRLVGRARGVPAAAGMYVASKYAVRALTAVLRKELVGRIRVSTVDPGMVGDTEFSDVRFRGDADKKEAVYAGVKLPDPRGDRRLHPLGRSPGRRTW